MTGGRDSPTTGSVPSVPFEFFHHGTLVGIEELVEDEHVLHEEVERDPEVLAPALDVRHSFDQLAEPCAVLLADARHRLRDEKHV